MASSAHSCLYRLDRSNMLSICRRAVGRRRLAAKRRGSSRLQKVSGNTASGQRYVPAIGREVLCLQHVYWITAPEFSRSTKLLRILCWYIESLPDPGCELCLSADVRTRKPTSASLICSAVLTLQGNKSAVCQSQPSASQPGLLTQVGHCTTAISQQLAFLGLKSNGLAHLFDDTAISHLQALAAGKLSEQTMCKQIMACARNSPLLVH